MPADISCAWAVDASCPGNPGPMEYRCIDLTTGRMVFHFGPIPGTNNIGEFLAVVHALALLESRGMRRYTVYTDSVTALAWTRKKKSATKLARNEETARALDLVARAETWLANHPGHNPVVKWNTQEWGEIPADFGRK